MPNCLEQLEVYWASAKIGAVVVPSSTLLLEKAMLTLLQDSDAAALITNASFAGQIDSIKAELKDIADFYHSESGKKWASLDKSYKAYINEKIYEKVMSAQQGMGMIYIKYQDGNGLCEISQ